LFDHVIHTLERSALRDRALAGFSAAIPNQRFAAEPSGTLFRTALQRQIKRGIDKLAAATDALLDRHNVTQKKFRQVNPLAI
jgi:hypothetical protein